MNQEDSRVIRTRQQLKQAFIQLVNERGFEAVSIRDVTEHASVGYRTFFRHYKDTRELLEDALSEFISEVRVLFVPPDSLEMTERNVVTMFQFIEKNVDLFRAFYRAPFFDELAEPMLRFGRKISHNVFGETAVPADLVDTHFLYSMMNLQRWWVENEMPIPPETMGIYAHSLIVKPIIEMGASKVERQLNDTT